MTNELSRKTAQAIRKYGSVECLKVLEHHEASGEGASTIANAWGLTTRQIDAMIEAGREIRERLSAPL